MAFSVNYTANDSTHDKMPASGIDCHRDLFPEIGETTRLKEDILSCPLALDTIPAQQSGRKQRFSTLRAQGSSQPVASCAQSPMDRVTEHFSHRMQKFHFVAQVKILPVISTYHPKTTINIMEDSIYTEAYLNRPEFRRSEGLIKLRTARISSAAESTASTRR